MSELYRPSNGTEGELFQDEFCDHCERDAAFRDDPDHNDGCEILARALAFDIDDPQYPKEWVRIEAVDPRDGLMVNCGKCTAFIPTGQQIPTRDDKTIDMFGAP